MGGAWRTGVLAYFVVFACCDALIGLFLWIGGGRGRGLYWVYKQMVDEDVQSRGGLIDAQRDHVETIESDGFLLQSG